MAFVLKRGALQHCADDLGHEDAAERGAFFTVKRVTFSGINEDDGAFVQLVEDVDGVGLRGKQATHALGGQQAVETGSYLVFRVSIVRALKIPALEESPLYRREPGDHRIVL